jgi:hypothetical protein
MFAIDLLRLCSTALSQSPLNYMRKGFFNKAGGSGRLLIHRVKGRAWKATDTNNELSEFDVREDLRSWEVVPKQ